MADWSTMFAGIGLLTNAATIGLVWLTFRETRTTANAAVASAGAAQAAVAHASQTAHRELRAYLGVKDGFVRAPNGNRAVGEVDIPNQGKTPAHNVNRFFEMALLDVDHSSFEPAPQEPGSWVIVPEAYWTLRKEIEITPQQLVEIRAKKKTISLWGKITYDDIYGEELRTSEFRYKLAEEIHEFREISGQFGVVDVFVGWKLDPTPEGNRST